jgi:hydrogenase maturation protease
MQPTLVLGIGNLLMGDEGVGVHALRRLQEEAWPPAVTLLDGGTGGFHLLEYLTGFPRVVMVDAAADGAPDGTVSVLRPQYASDFPRALTAHDIGLRDLIESAVLLGPLPEVTLVTVSISAIRPMVTELSPAVAGAIPEVRRRVREALSSEAPARA